MHLPYRRIAHLHHCCAVLVTCRPSPTRAPAVVIPRLNLPQLQQPSWHLPMADTALLTGASSEAALSSSYRTSITSASRGTPLTVMPLTTGRLTTGAADSSRGRATNAAGIGQHSSQLSGRLGSSARGQTRLSHLLEPCADAGQAGGAPCTPSTTAAVGPSQGPYAAHRAKCAVYMDLELHALCMELALHLLVTPNGQLDPVQLPHEPTGDCRLLRFSAVRCSKAMHGLYALSQTFDGAHNSTAASERDFVSVFTAMRMLPTVSQTMSNVYVYVCVCVCALWVYCRRVPAAEGDVVTAALIPSCQPWHGMCLGTARMQHTSAAAAAAGPVCSLKGQPAASSKPTAKQQSRNPGQHSAGVSAQWRQQCSITTRPAGSAACSVA